jgi:fructose-bisphosphate aldolase, class I
MSNNYTQELQKTARSMVAEGKGLLAMDESTGTCNQRFQKVGIPTTEENRRAYRELILTTPKLNDFISGAILFDETIHQATSSGVPFIQVMKDAGMIPGIKLDKGAKPLAGHPEERVTEGLDELRDRIAEYYSMGARFAKWRAVITIGNGVIGRDAVGKDIPSQSCIEANAHALARYAALCQEGGLVPIVEPEVLIDGDHTLERCYEVTEATIHEVFRQLYSQKVAFDQMILKPSMVISGAGCPVQASVDEVATATIQCLLNTVPAAVAGVAFLSGGQTIIQASAHLNAMHVLFRGQLPWPVTFSYARAIQQPALEHWKGDSANVDTAQKLLYHRAMCNGAASRGLYQASMEKEPVAARS